MMKLVESKENYLEAIFMLKKQNGEVRAVDIAAFLNFSKPSVSVALKQLRESGYIDVAPSGYISLTKIGLETATDLYERHHILSEFLVSLGVSSGVALEDACKIEHYLSKESYDKIKEHFLSESQKSN